MPFTLGEVLIWLIIGGLAGSFVGMLATRTKTGFGRWKNLGLGMAGALLGGATFELLGIDLGLGELSVSFEDLVAASVGAVGILLLVQVYRHYRHRRQDEHE